MSAPAPAFAACVERSTRGRRGASGLRSRGSNLIIDIVNHVLPQPVMERLERRPKRFGSMGDEIGLFPQLFDFDVRFCAMDEFGDYQQVISLSTPTLEEVTTADQGNDIARLANDSMAELVARHPARFPAFLASVAMHRPDEAVKEQTRAFDELGAAGVQLFTEVGDRPLDDPEFEPVFATAASRGRMILLHPARAPASAEFRVEDGSLFRVWQTLSWPFMTSVIMWRLICRGLFDRFPDIKILTHHLGGIIPYHANRVDRALQNQLDQIAAQGASMGDRTFKKKARDYLRMYYGDTAMHGAIDPVRCGLAYFGPDHVAFASDAPYGSTPAAMQMLAALELDTETRRKIERDNAERLLGLRA
jgi:predicted TIM-barrel fold metal-dependent hydrolase